MTPPQASEAAVGEDTARLDWLLARMTERQLNEILGGTHRAIFTVQCARSAIDHARERA